MTITLTITSYQKAALGAAAVRQFDHAGGSFGRDAANDWVLPDPERFISGIHGVIYFSDGCFWLRDESTNGIGVGAERVPVGRNRSVPLRDGETLTVGEYRIDVRVSAATGGNTPAPAAEPEPDAQALAINSPTFDPLKALGDIAPHTQTPATGGRQPLARGSEPDHTPAFLDPFKPPQAVQAKPAQAPAEAGWAVIPEDWDSAPTASPRAHAAPDDDPEPVAGYAPDSELQLATASEAMTSEPPAAESLPAGRLPVEPEETEPASAEPPSPTLQPRIDEPRITQPSNAESSIAEPVIDEAAVAAPPMAEPPTPEPRTPPPESAERSLRPDTAPGIDATKGDHADALRVFLQAAGLDPAHLRLTDDRQALQQFGEMFQHLLDGFMRLLRARAEMKNELRLAQTTIRPRENNPLKFCVGPADALQLLFAAQSPGYLAPQAAVEEAVADLAAHQIAMLAAMRAAVDDMIAKIAPERFQPRDDNGQPTRSWYPNQREGQAWRQYSKFHREVMSDSDIAFRQLIAERFMQVYEEQCRQLTKPRT